MKSRFNEMRLNQIEEDFRHDWRKHRTDIIQTIKDALREKNRWYFKNKLPLAEIKEINLPPDNSEELEALKKKVEDIIYKSLPRSSDDIKNHLIQYLNQGGIYGTPSNATTTSFTFWSKGILFPSCEILQIYVDENLDGSVRVTQRYIFKKPIALSKGKMPSIPLAVIETISEIKDVINTYKLNGTVIRSYKDGVQRHASSVPGMEVSHLYQTDNVYLLEGYTLELRSNLERDDKNNETSNKIYISPKNKTYDILDLEGNWQKGSLNNIDLSNLTNRLNDETLIMQILEITSTAGHTIFDLTNDEKRKSYIHKRYGMSVENVCKELAEKRNTEFEKSDRQKKLDSFFNNDEPNNHPDDSSISEIETVSPEIEKVEKKDEAMESSGESKEMSETSNSGEKMKDKTSEDISSSPDERIENDLAEEPLKPEEKIRHSDGENDSFYESNSSTSEEEPESSMKENSEEKEKKKIINISRFQEISDAYVNQNWQPTLDMDDNSIWFNNSQDGIDSLSIIDDQTREYIEKNINGFMHVSEIATRKFLDSKNRNDLSVEKIQNRIFEKYEDNQFGVRERLLIKNGGKNIAIIETESIISWNVDAEKIYHGINADDVYLFDQSEKDFFEKVFKENEATSIFEEYNQSFEDFNNNLDTKIVSLVKDNTSASKTPYNNKAYLDSLIVLNDHLFQYFDISTAKQAIWHANRLQKSESHVDVLQVDETIRSLIAIIQASTRAKKSIFEKVRRYAEDSPTYIKYAKDISGVYIKNEDEDASDKNITVEEKAKRKLEQTRLDNQYADDIILTDEFLQLLQRDNNVVSEANKIRQEFKNAIDTLKQAIVNAEQNLAKAKLCNHAVSALNLAIMVANQKWAVDITSARISTLSDWMRNIADILASPRIHTFDVNKIKQSFNEKSDWKTEFTAEINNINEEAAKYKIKNKNTFFNRFLRTIKKHPILTGVVAGLALTLVAAIIAAIVITAIIASGGTVAIPVTGTAIFLGSTFAGATATASVTSTVGAIAMAVGAGIASMFIGGILGAIYKTYKAVKRKIIGEPAKQIPVILQINEPEDVYLSDITKQIQQDNSNHWKKPNTVPVSTHHGRFINTEKETDKYITNNFSLLHASIRHPEDYKTWLEKQSTNIVDGIGDMVTALHNTLSEPDELKKFLLAVEKDEQDVLTTMLEGNENLKKILQRKNSGAEKWHEDNNDIDSRFDI